MACADPEGGTVGPDPPEKSQKYRVFLQYYTDPDPLTNHKATKPEFNVGPSSARQRNTISMVFGWRADDGPIEAVYKSSIPPSTKTKGLQIWTLSDKTFWIGA